jgi:hypothetical protein
MRMAVLALLAACSSSPPQVDAGQGPIDYKLQIGFDSYRFDMPRVYIDGVATMSFHHTYPDFSVPIQHEIELRYGDQVLQHMSMSAAPGGCPAPPSAVWSNIEQDVDALVSGDLRLVADDWRGITGFCTGDGGGDANHCGDCPNGRCAPRILRAQPLFTQMACVPTGSNGSGDPCTVIDDPAGAYDDCGENLVCIAGTCTPFCSPDIPDDYPPETTTCL